MVVIRLLPGGKKKKHAYRIVAVEHRRAVGSRLYLDLIGHYDPQNKAEPLRINTEKYYKRLSQGAQPSETVQSLVKQWNSISPAAPADEAVL
jgi:small subunit ribosomal protein S16